MNNTHIVPFATVSRGSPAATPEQLARVVTVCIRQDRFVEGDLAAAFFSGVLAAIVARAEALLGGVDP